MGKNKPLLWTAILAAAGTGSAFAQTDATSLITNPSFETAGGAGWTVELASNKNLHGGASSNYCAESYHSRFLVYQQLDVPNGVYRLTAQGFYRQDGSDNTNLPFFFANSETRTVPVKSGSENSMNDASASFTAGKYTIEPIVVEVTDGTLRIGISNTVNTNLWVIWDNFKLEFLGNATGFIKNPNFESQLADWTNDGFKSQNNTSFAKKGGTYYCERWQQSGNLPNSDIHQDLTNLPNGTYTLAVVGAFGGDGLYLYAGTKETAIKDEGIYFVKGVTVTDGKLTVGVKLKDAKSNWARFDNFQLNLEPEDVNTLKSELTELLAIQINKAGIYTEDETLQDLALSASAIQVKINNLGDDVSKYNSIKEEITAIGDKIAKAAANYDQYAKAVKEYNALVALLGDTEDELANSGEGINEGDEGYHKRTDDATDLANIYYNAPKSTQEAAKSLYEDVVAQVADFMADVKAAYEAGNAGSVYADDKLESLVKNLTDAIAADCDAIQNGSDAAISYTNVKNSVAEANNAYTTISGQIYAELITNADAKIEKVDGVYIYNDKYVKALSDLQVQVRNIQDEAKANEDEFNADPKKSNAETQAAHQAALSSYVKAMEDIRDEYINEAKTLRGYYTAACNDLKTQATDYLKTEITDYIGKRSQVTNAFKSKIAEINSDIAAIQAKIDAVNKAHTIGATPYEEYDADLTAVRGKIDVLKNSGEADVADVTKAVAEYDAYTAKVAEITKSNTEFSLRKSGKGKKNSLTDDANYTGVENMKSTDGKLSLKDKFDDVEKEIADAITALTKQLASVYKADGTGTAEDFDINANGIDSETGEVLYVGKNDIDQLISDYRAAAEKALSDYNDIYTAVKGYSDALEGTPAEKDKDGKVTKEATPGLVGTATNTAVTVDAATYVPLTEDNATDAISGTTYATKIAELRANIAKINTALTGALTKTGSELCDSLNEIKNGNKDVAPFPVTLDAAIASEIETLTTGYAANETNWSAAQLLAAKVRLLAEAQRNMDAIELVETYDAETYGKVANTDVDDKTKSLNNENAAIKATIATIKTNIDNAKKADASEAIALLSTIQTDIASINTQVSNLNKRAEAAQKAYKAEKDANKTLSDKIALLSAQLQGTTLNEVDYKGVAETLAPADGTMFDVEINNVQTSINAVQTALATSFAAETVVTDQEDTKDKDGKVTKKGYKTLLSEAETAINNLLDPLAKNESANATAYQKLQKDITDAKYDEKSAAVAAQLNDDAEGKVIATGTARAFYIAELAKITTAYQKNFVNADCEAAKANIAKVKSTLAGAIKDAVKYTDTAKNMVAKYAALKAALDKAIADAEALPALALANETAHEEFKADAKTALKTWNDLFAEISGAETSAAHEAAITTLTNLKERLDAFNTTLDDKFAKGLCDTDKTALDTEITDIQNKLNELNGSWKETYDAAITADNKARKEAFDNAYNALTETYQADVKLITDMSKLSYASGDNATETLLNITGEGGIYDYAQKIRDLKAKAAAEYAAVTASEETDLYDPEEENKKTAEDYTTEIKNLTKTYTDEVNNIAAQTYNDARDAVQDQYDAAKAEIKATLGYNDKQAADALSDVKKILDDAATARTQQNFATLLDSKILPAFGTVQSLIAADKEAAAEAAWFANTSYASNLARTEAAEIAEFLDGDGNKGKYSEQYDDFTEYIGQAAEEWAEIPEGEKFDNYNGPKGTLDNFLGEINTHGDAVNIGTEEEPVYAEHTNIYWNAYDEDKAFHANDIAYDQMLGYIQNAQEELDNASGYVGSLIIEHDADLNTKLDNRQSDIDYYSWAAKRAHDYGYASGYLNQIEVYYNNFVAQVNPPIYDEAVTKEKAALATEIGLLKTDWDKAAAAIINSDDMDLVDNVNGYRDLYDEYTLRNNTIAQNYTQVLDEDGVPVYEKDADGNDKIDEATGMKIPVRVSAEDTQAAFLALEKEIANSKADLADIYDKAASANAAKSVEDGIAGLQATYDALTAQLAECHEPVKAAYADEVEALKAAIDAVQADLDKEKAENTVLLYVENNLKSIEKAADAVDGLSVMIAADEEPYDVNDAKYVELKAQLAAITTRLNEVYDDAVENHEYYAQDDNPDTQWSISTWDDEGNEVVTKFDTYRDFRKAQIESWIADATKWVEDDHDDVLLNEDTEIGEEFYYDQIAALDKNLKSYNANQTIYNLGGTNGYTAGTALRAARDAFFANNYAPEDRAALLEKLNNALVSFRNLRTFNNAAQNDEVTKDIDGNYIEWTEVDAEGVEHTYSTDSEADNYNGPKPVVYTEEYAAIMARAQELEEFASAFVQEVDAKAWKRGDVNRDGKINVIDYAAVRNYALNPGSLEETDPIFYAADVNNNGDVDIADVTAVAYYIMNNNTWPAGAGAKAFGAGATEDAIELAVVGSGSKQQIVISLNNSRSYVGAQMDIELPAGVSIVGESLTSRAQGHELLSADNDGKHRILISSINNPEFDNSESALVVLDVEVSGSYSGGDIAVTGIKVAEANARTHNLADVVIGGEATGIAELSAGEKIVDKIYSAGGQLVNALKKGINIIRNNDGSTKKVLVK